LGGKVLGFPGFCAANACASFSFCAAAASASAAFASTLQNVFSYVEGFLKP
jgi:hypothetical protein